MEMLDRIGHRPTPVPQASHPPHDRGPAASLETDAGLRPLVRPQAEASLAMKGLVRYTSTSVRTIGSGAVITRLWGGQNTLRWISCISCGFGWRRWT